MTCICDILYYSIFENVRKYHNVIVSETCFQRPKVLNNFINDISKSRNTDFCSGKGGEKGGSTYILSMEGGRTNREVEIFKGGLTPWRTPRTLQSYLLGII